MVLEVFTFIGLLAGYLISLRIKSNVAVFIQQWIHLPDIMINTVSFLLIFVLIIIIFRIIAVRIREFFKWTFLGWIDRGGGFLIGLLKGGLIASLVVLLISIIPFSERVKKEQETSFLFLPVRAIAPAVFNLIKKAYPKTEDFYIEVKQGLTAESQKAVDNIVSEGVKSLEKKAQKKISQELDKQKEEKIFE